MYPPRPGRVLLYHSSGRRERPTAKPQPDTEPDLSEPEQAEPKQTDADFLAELDRLKMDFRADRPPQPEPRSQPRLNRPHGFWQGTQRRRGSRLTPE